MRQDKIVIIGINAPRAKRLLEAMLEGRASAPVVMAYSYTDPNLIHVTADAVVFLPIQGDLVQIKTLRRFLRNLPYRKGMVVTHSHDKGMRMASKGFSHTFRWYSKHAPWPTLARYALPENVQLEVTAVSRLAHEMGYSSSKIKAVFPLLLDYLT